MKPAVYLILSFFVLLLAAPGCTNNQSPNAQTKETEPIAGKPNSVSNDSEPNLLEPRFFDSQALEEERKKHKELHSQSRELSFARPNYDRVQKILVENNVDQAEKSWKSLEVTIKRLKRELAKEKKE